MYRRTIRRVMVGLLGAAVIIAVVTGGIRACRHDKVMHVALMELQAANQADTVFRSDSAAQALVRYFDHLWHRRNDRILAYYLLGRAHADMGEAPQAIEAYQTAAELADTTSADCDFRLLRSVYGQMAEVFDSQNLPEDEIEAQKMFNKYSWMIGDTLEAISGYRRLERAYYLLGENDSILIIDDKVRNQLLALGYKERAASTLITPIYIYLERQEYEKAQQGIDIVRSEANIFNEDGTLKPGREMFYYTLGYYFDGINQLDTAEYYYRQVLTAGEQEAGYKGLLSVYCKRGISDSIAKFAPLYADANDAMHSKMNSDMVHQTNAQYQYARHQRLAHRYEQQASRRLRIILVILCLLFLSIVLYYRHHRHVQKVLQEKENHLLTLHLQLMAVTDSLRSLKQRELGIRKVLEKL